LTSPICKRALCADVIGAGEQQLLRELRADDPRHEQRHDGGTESHLGLAEDGRAVGDGQVAGERELERAARQ
jgi:hypothetical protein